MPTTLGRLDHWLDAFLDYATTKRALFHELVDAIGRDSELLTHSRAVIDARPSRCSARPRTPAWSAPTSRSATSSGWSAAAR